MNDQKIKLLVMYDILQRETNADHPITRKELCSRLNAMGISSNVRVVTRDIKTLCQYGYNVISFIRNHEACYYAEKDMFSTAELKILLDAVQAANFIDDKKTAVLTQKIQNLGSQNLEKSMVCFNTRKHRNENTFDSIETLESAIRQKKMVQFHYFDLDEFNQRVLRKTPEGEDKLYSVEPVALIYCEDFYYLMAYSSHHPGSTANYRIDRMLEVAVIEDSEISKEALKMIDEIADYTEQVFKMYNGETADVSLLFDRSLIGVVYDKFGEYVTMEPAEDGKVRAKVTVRVSPVFYGWVFQFGNKMVIESPEKCREEFNKMKRE